MCADEVNDEDEGQVWGGVAPHVRRVAGEGRRSPRVGLALADGGCSSGRVGIPSAEDLCDGAESPSRQKPVQGRQRLNCAI